MLDAAHLLAVVGGRRALVGELAALFDEDAVQLVAQLHEGVARGDAAAIALAAHTLAGSAGTLAGLRTARLAGALEAKARAGKLEGAREAIDILGAEVAKLRSALHAMVSAEPPPGGGEPE